MPRISHLFHFVMCFLRPKVFMCIQSGRDSTPTIGDFGLWHYIVDGQDWPFLNRLFVFLMLFSGKSDKASIFPTESIGCSGIFCSLKPIHGLLSCWLTHVHTIPERRKITSSGGVSPSWRPHQVMVDFVKKVLTLIYG